MLALPIFPGRHQPSIVGANELNFRVRDGNGWTLIAISTDSISTSFYLTGQNHIELYFILPHLSRRIGDPWESRTPVCGVRGRRLNRLTNGPNGTPSGTRTLDTLIKSQVLYQLS